MLTSPAGGRAEIFLVEKIISHCRDGVPPETNNLCGGL